MLDIKLIRTEPDKVKAAMRKRNKDMDAQVDEILAIDERRRQLSSESDNLKAQQNKASKEIPRIKKEGGDTTAIMAEMKLIAEKVKNLAGEISQLEEKQRNILLSIPNIPNEAVKQGVDDSQLCPCRGYECGRVPAPELGRVRVRRRAE